MKLLVIDDSASARSFVIDDLKEISDCVVEEAASGNEGIQKALDLLPDIIVLDMELGDINGVEVIKTLRKNEKTNQIPIIVLTAYDNKTLKTEAFDAGAAEFVVKPMQLQVLKGYVEELTTQHTELQGCSILVVDDAKETLELLKRLLTKLGAKVMLAEDGKKAVSVLKTRNVDILITDYMMPNMNGIELCSHVREVLERPELPIIMLTGIEESVLEALKAGADDYLLKPFSREELFARVFNHSRILNYYRNQQANKEKLQQTTQLAALGAFASTFSDDLTEHMGVIDKAVVEIENSLLEDVNSPSMRALNSIQESTDNVKQLLKHLKAFSRDKPKEERVKGDLVEHLKETLSLFSGKLDKEKILTKFKWDENITEIICDFPNIQQAFSNVLLNATESMQQSSKKHLMIRVFEDDSDVVIEVEDTGRGITRANQAKIFDPFFTTKPDVRGAGMGLAVCHGIFEDHGGAIQLMQSSRKGTTIRMTLPKGIWFL